MKKFLIVLSCFAFLIPLVALSSFALEPVDADRDSVDFSIPHRSSSAPSFSSLVFYPFNTYSHFSSGIAGVTSLNLGSGYIFISGVRFDATRIVFVFTSESDVLYAATGSHTTLISSDGSLNADWDGVIYLNSSFTPSDVFLSWYNSFPGPLIHDLSEGVGGFIGCVGELFAFLTSNSTTIVLIGLSVAMFAILPFAIRKIKQLIKGY